METDPRDASLAFTHGADATTGTEDGEMPLLFMDGLPSNFQENAQLAAIATFMSDSDDDLDDSRESASEATGKRRSHPPKEEKKRSQRQKPYARKPSGMSRNEEKKAGTDKKAQKEDTKELQLFLSMFHVS